MKNMVPASAAISDIFDGATIMIGGFMCCGQPLSLIDALINHTAKDLTIICNDAGIPNTGVAKLISSGKVKHLIASHIGLNPEAGIKMHDGSMQVSLVPQGTLAERIRCAGAGMGGFLTPTGIGTEVEKDKQKVVVDCREFLLETPLSADFALVVGDISDKVGNTYIGKSRKNFNTVMAMAARQTIVEARKVVSVGDLDADKVTIPGVFVQTLVEVLA